MIAKSVTAHAIERWRQRGGRRGSDLTVTGWLFRIVDDGQEIQPAARFRVYSLLQHNFVEARYFELGDWVAIVAEGEIKTVFRFQKDRWEIKTLA